MNKFSVKQYSLWLLEMNNLKNLLFVFTNLIVLVGLGASYGFLMNRPKVALISHNPIVVVNFEKFKGNFKEKGNSIPLDLEAYSKEEGMRSAVLEGNRILPLHVFHYLPWYAKVSSKFYDKYDKQAIDAKDFNQTKFELSTIKQILGYEEYKDEGALSASNIFKSPINFGIQLQKNYGSTILGSFTSVEFFRDIFMIEIEKLESEVDRLAAYRNLAEARVVTITPFEIKNSGKSDAIDTPVSINMLPFPSVSLVQEVLEGQAIQVDNSKKRVLNVSIPFLKPGQSSLIVFQSKNQPITSKILSVGIPKGGDRPNFAWIWLSIFLIVIGVFSISIRDFQREMR